MSSQPMMNIRYLEQDLRESERKFHALAEASSAAVFLYEGTRLCYVNPAASVLTGYAAAELLQMNFYDLAPQDERKRLRSWGMRIQRGVDEPQKQTFTLLTKTGEKRRVSWTATRIEHKGKPAGLGILVDVTPIEYARRFEMTVHRLLESVWKATDEKELCAALHEVLRSAMPVENLYVILGDSSLDQLNCFYQAGSADLGAEAKDTLRDMVKQVLKSGRTQDYLPGSWQKDREQGQIKDTPPQHLHWLIAPMTSKDVVIGVLAVCALDPYTERDHRFLESVASISAAALSLFSRAPRLASDQHANNFTVFYEIARDLTLQRSRACLLSVIVDHVMKLTNPSGCALYLCDEIQGELEAVETKGAWNLRGEQVKIGADLVGRAAEARQVVMAENYRPACLPETEPSADFAVAVPLIFSNVLEGVLLVYGWGKDGYHHCSQEGIQLLKFFADISAIALNNASLFDETRQRLVEIEVLYQASLAATQIHSVKAVAQRIAETLERLMGWQVSLWLLDSERQRPSLLAYGSSHLPPEKRKEQQERLDMGIIGWVCRTGQTVRANDVRSDPRYVEGDSTTRSELCVPLKVGGRVIGCINMESPHENAFGEHDERLLTTLANQAAIAIENARLFEETRRRAARQSALNEIIMAAARVGTDLDAFLHTALDRILQALGLDMGALWLMPHEHRPHHVAMRGIPASLDTKMIHLQTIGEADLSHVTVVQDWSKETGPLADLLTSLGIFSSLAIPLYLEDRCVGGLAVAAPAPRRWTEEEIELARIVGQEIGGTAERMRLFEETRTRLQELETINRVSMSLRLAHSLNEMLSHLLEEATRALRAQAGGVWLYDEREGRLRLAIGHNWVAHLARAEVKREDGIARTVFASGDIYFSRNVATDPMLSWPAREVVPPDWGALYVPICTDQKTIGVLMVADRLPREFSVNDARLTATLAEMAGNAIQRMILYEQTQRHAVELEQRVAERTAALQQALQRAQEVDRLKSEFIANINHELRTPLTNLVLYYQMLRAQPNVQTEERLDVIGRELERLRRLIEDLLSLSRLEAGRVPFSLSLQNLNEVLRVLVEDRRSLAEERNLELRVELEEDLPLALFDRQMISQAFSNLLTNALNYTPPHGQVRVRTMLGQFSGETYVGLSVQDTGPGVDAEDLPHIFERFYRGRVGRESSASGTGLGLAIVKQVVEYHKGKIEVANGLLDGRGASFTIWLPVGDHSTASPTQARS